MVDLAQGRRDVAHHLLEDRAHVVERAVGEDDREFLEPVRVDRGEKCGHGFLLFRSFRRSAEPSECKAEAARSAERAGAAFLAEKDIGLDIADAGKGHDPAPEDTLEIGKVAGADAQPVVVKAEDVLHHLHLGDGGHRALEILKPDAAPGGELDAEKDGDAESEPLGIEVDTPAGEDARLLEPPDTAPGGGLRQPQRAADGARASRGVGHKGAQDGAVGIVEVDHSGRLPVSLIVATSMRLSMSAICGRVRMRSR